MDKIIASKVCNNRECDEKKFYYKTILGARSILSMAGKYLIVILNG